MKFKIFFVIVFGLVTLAQYAQEGQNRNRKTKELKPSMEKKNEKASVIFNSSELGGLWNIEKANDQLVYNPDSMRKTNKYTKYIFSLNEFKNANGDVNSKSDLIIYYTISNTERKNYTPEDPNMPSPSGGFIYINHTCKIIKIEAN